MNRDEKQPRSTADEELEREIRKDRKFTLAEAIGRMAGPGAMKGVSPITRQKQAEVEIENWLGDHLSAANDELRIVINRRVKGSELLMLHYEQPFVVLAALFRKVLDSDYLLKELVREADVEWARLNDERPYFEKEGSAPHPDDPYTVGSVRALLTGLIEQLSAGGT